MALEQRLLRSGFWATVLDGDNVRHGLCGDLGFSPEDRRENLRRVGAVAQLFYDAGLITICAFVSPERAARAQIRNLFPSGRFLEIHMATPLTTCEDRDPKGLYQKARAGEITDMTGVDAPYEAPKHPEYRFDTTSSSVEDIVSELMASAFAAGE
jgi:adenylyl-sulfate kinase